MNKPPKHSNYIKQKLLMHKDIFQKHYLLVKGLIIWLTDFACCDWSIPGP